jgi:hypothetical protein
MGRIKRRTGTVPVDSNVKTEQLNKALLVAEAKEVGKVVRVILGYIDRRKLAASVDVAEDATRDVRELSDAEKPC